MNVSRETIERLNEYHKLLETWSRRINLVSASTLADVWDRHVEDSLQLAEHGAPNSSWCDLGSGGGFPGLVVAIARPDLHVTMIESDRRKAVFLRHVADSLRLDATILAERIETAPPAAAATVSARALAPLDRLLPLAHRHGTRATRFLFPKGRRYRSEIAAAQKAWTFDVDARPSRVEKDGVVLIVENIARV